MNLIKVAPTKKNTKKPIHPKQTTHGVRYTKITLTIKATITAYIHVPKNDKIVFIPIKKNIYFKNCRVLIKVAMSLAHFSFSLSRYIVIINR